MYSCSKCGANKWKWTCKNGMMKGLCPCGAETNEFKADGRHQKNKKEDYNEEV